MMNSNLFVPRHLQPDSDLIINLMVFRVFTDMVLVYGVFTDMVLVYGVFTDMVLVYGVFTDMVR